MVAENIMANKSYYGYYGSTKSILELIEVDIDFVCTFCEDKMEGFILLCLVINQDAGFLKKLQMSFYFI